MTKNIQIKAMIDLEPIVKLECISVNCVNNLAECRDIYCCNLKHISIDENGKCNLFRKSNNYYG